jgi:hypothetical protein
MISPKIYALLAIAVMCSLPAVAQDQVKGKRMRKVSEDDRRLGKNVRNKSQYLNTISTTSFFGKRRRPA